MGTKQKTVIVTGASQGIGAGVVQAFLDRGYNVVANSRNITKSGAFTGSGQLVLVDGDTASAAEVVAGALKENNRARLIGETTFGKGSIQKLVQFDSKVPGGMRITVAHFLSPSNQPYHGQGVVPHRVIEQSETGGDTQLQAAKEEARALANAMRNMKMKMMQ